MPWFSSECLKLSRHKDIISKSCARVVHVTGTRYKKRSICFLTVTNTLINVLKLLEVRSHRATISCIKKLHLVTWFSIHYPTTRYGKFARTVQLDLIHLTDVCWAGDKIELIQLFNTVAAISAVIANSTSIWIDKNLRIRNRSSEVFNWEPSRSEPYNDITSGRQEVKWD